MDYGAQEEVVRFLAAAGGGTSDIRATHISVVLLGRSRVFKLKRAVRFPYLDFSTPRKRLEMCEREVALNRRTAPALYLGLRRITRESGGGLVFDGLGELVDAVVEMRRFDENALLDHLAAGGLLTRAMIEALAERLADFHGKAEICYEHGGAAGMARVVELAERSSRETPPASDDALEERAALIRERLAANAALLEERRLRGKVRRCHGDLTLRNICLLDGEPTPFDCIEFSDDLATIDVLYDLAFLLMDLRHAGAADLANLALNRYLDHRDETDGLPLLPLFQALRATIRAYVSAAQGKRAEADSYFHLAGDLLAPGEAKLVAIGGFSGSGKSSVAARLASRFGPAPGARILNSDRLRKRMFGAAPTDRLPPSAYESEVSARVYARMFGEARRAASAGWPVILDAVLDRQSDRETAEAMAGAVGLPFFGFWLEADMEQRARRVDERLNDVSDANREVAIQQARRDAGPMGWTTIDASRPLDEIVADVATRIFRAS